MICAIWKSKKSNVALLALSAVCLTWYPIIAYSQSVVTLDDFDLNDQNSSTDMENCLLDQRSCTSEEYRVTTRITMDDVLNLGVVDREKVNIAKTDIQEPLPTVDMEILFDYDSAFLREDQQVKVEKLYSMLASSKFSHYNFVFLGHTDLKGSDSYNVPLSERRAEAVARFVSSNGQIDLDRISWKGLGSTMLKVTDDPYSGQNRRVQLLLIPRKG